MLKRLLTLANQLDAQGLYKEADLITSIATEYKGKKVKLNDPIRNPSGSKKKFKVYVKDPKTKNVKKVEFGDPKMDIKRDDPERRKSFRARHKCDTPAGKDKTKARYWSCFQWRDNKKVDSAYLNMMVKLADDLDTKGLYQEADLIDQLIKHATDEDYYGLEKQPVMQVPETGMTPEQYKRYYGVEMPSKPELPEVKETSDMPIKYYEKVNEQVNNDVFKFIDYVLLEVKRWKGRSTIGLIQFQDVLINCDFPKPLWSNSFIRFSMEKPHLIHKISEQPYVEYVGEFNWGTLSIICLSPTNIQIILMLKDAELSDELYSNYIKLEQENIDPIASSNGLWGTTVIDNGASGQMGILSDSWFYNTYNNLEGRYK